MQSGKVINIYLRACVCVFDSLAAAVEGHAQSPQKTDRHGDGRDGQHLSLVHLFALCRETKTGGRRHINACKQSNLCE